MLCKRSGNIAGKVVKFEERYEGHDMAKCMVKLRGERHGKFRRSIKLGGGGGGALTRERQISAVIRACDSKLGAEKGRVCRWPMGVGPGGCGLLDLEVEMGRENVKWGDLSFVMLCCLSLGDTSSQMYVAYSDSFYAPEGVLQNCSRPRGGASNPKHESIFRVQTDLGCFGRRRVKRENATYLF